MNKLLAFLQWFNILGISNFLTAIFLRDKLSMSVVKFSMAYSISIIVLTSFLIIYFGYKTFRRVSPAAILVSSHLSPLRRFLLPNVLIAILITMIGLGLYFNQSLLAVGVAITFALLYPFWVNSKTLIVAVTDTDVLVYDYSGNPLVIKGQQLVGIKRILFGSIYNIKYLDSNGKISKVYFLDAGIFSVFQGSRPLKVLKDIVQKKP